jgi:hypothetical protein
MIHQYRKKVADMMLAKKEMDQTRDKVARFYEEVLEVDNAKKLPAHKFETILNIEQEYDSKVFASLAEVIDRCDMMQKQAKEIEKESWLKWYQKASDTRSKHHTDIVERSADLHAKNKDLAEKIIEIESHAVLERVAAVEKRRALEEELSKMKIELDQKDDDIATLKRDNQIATDAIKEFDIRFDKMKQRQSDTEQAQQQQQPPSREGEWVEVVRGRGTGGSEGRGGCRSAAGSSGGQRGAPQFLNQTQTFQSSSSSSSSSQNSQRFLPQCEKQKRK